MARHVFFSFNYEDVKNLKANIVRNSWLTKDKENSFNDSSIWEEAKMKGPKAIKDLILEGMTGSSTTVVLIGKNTANRRWVNYEIVRSFERGNGIIGIHINRLKGNSGTTTRGLNPLDRLGFQISEDGKKISFHELKRGKWREFTDLKTINNKKSNTLFFENRWWKKNEYGTMFKFSEKFPTHCWNLNNGYENFSDWVEKAYEEANK